MEKDYSKSAFYGFSDEKQTKLFFEALGHITELLDPEEVYEFLHNDYEVPDTDIHYYGLMGEEHLMGEGIPIGAPRERTPLWTVMRHINFEKDILLTHEKCNCKPLARSLCTMGNVGQKKYASLLEATVVDSRMGEKGLELVLDGIDPKLLENFSHDFGTQKPVMQGMAGLKAT